MSLRALSKRYGINPKTVAQWKKRTSAADLRTGPKAPRSTVLSSEDEAVVVAFRRHTLVPLDDCLYPLQALAMVGEIPSVGDRRRKSEATDAQIRAAKDAYLKTEGAEPSAFKSGHTIDVAKAIEMHPQAKTVLADKAATPSLRRVIVMTAVPVRFRIPGSASLPI